MKKSKVIWLAIAGVLLIVLGVLCICRPAATLFTTAWLIGIITLLAGISKLVFTFKTQSFLPNSGSRVLSALLEILIGVVFLSKKLFVALSLPFIFTIWVLVESLILAVNSFDYKQVGYKWWWCLFLAGIAGVVLGFLGLRNPDVSATALTLTIGIVIILIGVADLVAICGITKFENKVKEQIKALE